MNFEKMSLKEKVLQTFVVTVREINKYGGPERFFKKYPVGGMYYAKSKDPDIEKKTETGTATCLKRLKQCQAASGFPLLVCADGALVEGQRVTASARSLGASRSEEDAYQLGKILGMQMNSNGIDWILGPCIDLLADRSMPLFAMSDDPKLSARLFRQVVRGIQDQGVCATVKHFPGMGTNNVNMHFGPGQNTLSMEDWMKSYGYVYQEMFQEGALSVMTTHTTLKAFDPEGEEGYYPIATYSRKLTQELLKEKLGFEGAVVTDALIMGGMATGDLIEETVQAFKCGADLLLWPPVEAADRITKALESGEIPMSRLEDALERIGKLRTFREKALAEKSFDKPDREFADKASEKILCHGICALKNELGLLPLDKERYQRFLILDVTEEGAGGSSYLLQAELEKRGVQAEVKRDIYDVDSRVCWQDEIDALQVGYDFIIFNVNTNYATAWNVPFMLIWASHLFDKKKKLILNYGSPFFAPDYFPEDPTLIEMNTAPSETAVRAAVDRILGEAEFTGHCVLTEQKKQK